MKRNINIIIGFLSCGAGILLIILSSIAVSKPPGEIVIMTGLTKITYGGSQGSVLAFGFAALVLFGIGTTLLYEQIRQRREALNALSKGIEAINKKGR